MKGKTDYSSNGHTLVGALVGGPADSNFTYTDSVNDYQANEVAWTITQVWSVQQQVCTPFTRLVL